MEMNSEQLESHPVAKLGEYKVISDIAEGAFGKVKSESSSVTQDAKVSTNWQWDITL